MGVTKNGIGFIGVGCLCASLLSLCHTKRLRLKTYGFLQFVCIPFFIRVFVDCRTLVRLTLRRTRISPPNSLYRGLGAPRKPWEIICAASECNRLNECNCLNASVLMWQFGVTRGLILPTCGWKRHFYIFPFMENGDFFSQNV